MYSVQQLSKMYGCTRQTIYSKLEHEDIQAYTTKDDKGLKLMAEGLNVLNNLMSQSKVNTIKHETNNQKDTSNTVNFDLYVESLKQSIELLNRQVEDLTQDKARLYEELREQRQLLTSKLEEGSVSNRGIFSKFKSIFKGS